MRNGVYAAISLAVAVTAATLALLLGGDSPSTTGTRTVAPVTVPDPRPSIPTPTRTPAPRAMATPSPTPAAPPPPTPTPPSPGVLTLAPSSGVAAGSTAPERTSPPPIPYGAFDAAGEASTAGSYALLVVEDGVTRTVETYEELRTKVTLARFHTVDAEGESRAERYDAVAVGDLFEWRQAEDCWTRYQVTSTQEPAEGVTTREFGVRWMTYAFTGCSGPIAPDAAVALDLGPLPDLGNPRLAYPIRHGPWQLVPEDWGGDTEAAEDRRPPWRYDRAPLPDTRLFHARQLPYWRDPALSWPWTLLVAERESASPYQYGYRATYGTTTGIETFTISASVAFLDGERTAVECESVCHETRVIAGRPARISYSPPNPFNPTVAPATVRVYDRETEARYVIRESDQLLLGGRIADALAIARSLFEPEPEHPGVLRYGHVDTLGTVEEPGSYAFLSGTDPTAPVVDTFDGLRDGSATALLIHTADVDGTSHGERFDSLAAGDRFEWRRADDCWVRYRVTEVLPEPARGVPRKLLGVESETYAFTGCRGVMPEHAYATFDFNPLPDLGGTTLATLVVHGPWQLVPEDWEGERRAVRATTDRRLARNRRASSAVPRIQATWRWPWPSRQRIASTLPPDWVFAGTYSGSTPRRHVGLVRALERLVGGRSGGRDLRDAPHRGARRAPSHPRAQGRPSARPARSATARALVTYSPARRGPRHHSSPSRSPSTTPRPRPSTRCSGYDPSLAGSQRRRRARDRARPLRAVDPSVRHETARQ